MSAVTQQDSTTIETLASDLQRLTGLGEHTMPGADKAQLVWWQHRSSILSTHDTANLAPLLAGEGWLITTRRVIELPLAESALQDNEQILEGELWLADERRTVRLHRQGAQLVLHLWTETTGNAEGAHAWLSMPVRHAHRDRANTWLDYVRLHDTEGRVRAALFTGFSEGGNA